MKSLLYAESWDEIEGESRLFLQLPGLIRNREKLRKRKVVPEDIDFVKDLVFNTIGFLHHYKEIFKGTVKSKDSADYVNQIIEYGEIMGIIMYHDVSSSKIYGFKEEYRNFFEENYEF